MTHRGTYDRGFLPHRDYFNSLLALTFRLDDSLPRQVIQKWQIELASDPERADDDLHRRIAQYEDAGHGSCLLGEPEHAAIVQATLIAGHPDRYRLLDWCIMPNHVHAMIRLTSGFSLAQILQLWKGGSALQINRLTGRTGRLWGREYFDRLIRDEQHYFRAKRYIRRNPVKAGLCREPEDWPFSSAGIAWDPD
ncbi:REP-associated tyrosine transposase [Haloferula sargassicola]|uniref:Transposase IS200-like domain-containing protein n=1 Tax=Haloferula sargassicola TaxID=490096 RepID=A0ABP9UU02_9BACT